MLVQALAGSSVDSHVGTRKLDLLKMWIAEVLAHTFTGSSVVKHSLVQEPALMGHHGHGAISSPGLFMVFFLLKIWGMGLTELEGAD